MDGSERQFSTAVVSGGDGRAYVEVPFDPAEAWGEKERHHVTGSVNGVEVRGPLEFAGRAWRLILGPTWRRGAGGAAF